MRRTSHAAPAQAACAATAGRLLHLGQAGRVCCAAVALLATEPGVCKFRPMKLRLFRCCVMDGTIDAQGGVRVSPLPFRKQQRKPGDSSTFSS
eukprot:1145076-Pelagomonas_calceolata.AAC.2